MTSGRPGLEDAKRVPVLDVARALGCVIGRDGRSFGPCPSCGATVRASDGKSDKRGRCRVFEDGQGWACNTNGSEGCGAKGDGPGLVSWKLCGRAGPKGSDVRTVLDWYRERGGLDSGAGWSQGEHAPGAVPSEAPAVPVPANRPPRGELWRVWSQCVPVTQDDAVSAWLLNHHEGPIDPALVAWLDLARALPMGLDLPRWARGPDGRRWDDAGYRVIVRLFGAGPDGAGLPTLSLHARNVRPEVKHKGVSPHGFEVRGLVLAWSPGMPFLDRPMEAPEASVLELAEGVPDWLRLTLERWQAPGRPTVWGCISGSASDEIAARVPDGWRVAIRTHDDDGGRKFLDRWSKLLDHRCDVRSGLVPNPKKGAA